MPMPPHEPTAEGREQVRAMAGYGLPDCLRVTIGTEEEMRATAEALSEVMS